MLFGLVALTLQLVSAQAAPATAPQSGQMQIDPAPTNPIYLPHIQRAQASIASTYASIPGFPREADGRMSSPPLVADIDSDGHNELLVATDQATIYAWSAAGALRPGYPIVTPGRIDAPLAVGDLNGDGDLEIAAGIGSTAPGVAGRVFVWQPDGTLLPGWPQTVDLFDTSDNSQLSSVVLADVDNNGELDVIAVSDNNILGTSAPPGTDIPDVYVWNRSGQLLAGNWPAKDGPSIRGTVAVGRFDDDSQLDLVLGRDYQWLFAYDALGNPLSGWPIETLVPQNGGDQDVDPRIVQRRAMPSLADLDGDGVVECVVAGIRRLPGSEVTVNSDLLVLEPDGTRRPGWELPASGTGYLQENVIMDQAPAIADLDGDGQLDIVVPTQDGWIRAYRADKTLLWQFDYAKGQLIWSTEPVIGDIDGDGRNEVVFGTYDPTNTTVAPLGLWVLEHDGAVKLGSPLEANRPGIAATPMLADLNQDGVMDIIAVSRNGTIYAWSTAAPYDPARLPWPAGRLNLQRTAAVTRE